MKVNSLEQNNISFNGFYDSKFLKKTLKFAEKNGALFASTTALILSATARPAAILSAPKTDKENKKLACAKAITSTLLEFGITYAISYPIVKSVGKINKNPQKYLKQSTIDNLKEGAESLTESKAYTLANQMFKLGVGVAIAAPKAILNILGLPLISKLFFKEGADNTFSATDSSSVSFKGKSGQNKLPDIIGKIMDNKKIQDFSKKNADSNFPMHINVTKDLLTTGVFSGGVYKSKKIKDDRKGALIYNSLLSTGLCVVSGYLIDYLTKKPADKFIARLKSANPNDKDIKKYIDGFKNAKPILILGITYYAIIPFISTFLAERIDKKFPLK